MLTVDALTTYERTGEHHVRQIALCQWCHQTTPVASRKEADIWLRTHKCSERTDQDEQGSTDG